MSSENNSDGESNSDHHSNGSHSGERHHSQNADWVLVITSGTSGVLSLIVTANQQYSCPISNMHRRKLRIMEVNK